MNLGSGKQIKTKGGSEGRWQSMKGNNQVGSVGGAGIACQPLVPGEPLMRALRSGEDLLMGAFSHGGESGAELSRHSVWLRTTFSQVRRSRGAWCAHWIGR